MNLTLKGLTPEQHQYLKSRAKANGRSLNKEAISILTAKPAPSPNETKQLIEEIRAHRAKMNIKMSQDEIVRIIREGRDGRY